MFPEQAKFTLGPGLGTEPLGYTMDEDKDGGIGFVTSPSLPSSCSPIPFRWGRVIHRFVAIMCLHR